MAERKTIVYPNPEMLAQAVAARTLLTIIDLLAEPERRRVDIAVTGGTDGNRVFAAMNASPLNDAVDWNRVHVWWGDERFVAADDDDRNAKQAREAWYGALVEDGRMPAGNVHAMPADTRSATEIAEASPEQTDAVLAEAPTNTSVSWLRSWEKIRHWISRCSAWGRTRISRPCSPTMANPRSPTPTCWWRACAIHRSRRRCD